jgi:hypothetical protein
MEDFMRRLVTDPRAQGAQLRGILGNMQATIKEILAGRRRQEVGVQATTKTCPPPDITGKDLRKVFRADLELLDLSPLEVARQITLVQHATFAPIRSFEFLTALSNRGTTSRTPMLHSFFLFGDALMRVFAEAFLSAKQKEAAYDRLIKILRALYDPGDPNTLGNVEGASCLLHFLMREDVKKIAKATPQQCKELAELLRQAGDCTGQAGDYEQFITRQSLARAAGIPNMRAELLTRDTTGVERGPSVTGVINWAQVRSLATRCLLLKRFQTQPYKLIPIPQIQKVILKEDILSESDIEDKIEELSAIDTRGGQ